MIAENIKFLRKKHNYSQQQLADLLSVPRSSMSDYERGHTQLNFENLITLADIFSVKIDDLLKSKLWQDEMIIASSPGLKILAISVDAQQRNHIELVDTKAEAGYLSSYADPEYVKDLPKMSFPMLPDGTYRAFQISGDSMLPMESGSIVICAYVERLQDIKTDKTYIIISKTEGVVYKRVRPDVKKKTLQLISDNEMYLPYEIPFDSIDEIWQYQAHVAFSDAKTTFNVMLDDRLSDIQRKVSEVHANVFKKK
jgi:transcriptional regulator with XRE-family HTH domain